MLLVVHVLDFLITYVELHFSYSGDFVKYI